MASGDNRDEESPLVVEKLVSLTHQDHWRDVHILSSAFLLIFLAYGAAQNLETTVNTDGNLGTISLGILYTSFTIFSLFASMLVRVLGSKNAIVLGTTGYWLFVAANLKPNWYTMIPASLYLGFCASIIWVGQATYLTSAASIHARANRLHEGTVIGKFNGEFWGFFASHQFVGNLVTLAVLKDGNDGTTSGTTLLFILFLCIMSLGVILMWFLTKRDAKVGEETTDSSVGLYSSIMSLSKLIITPLFDTRMLLIIPLFAYSGLQQSFVWAEFTKAIVTPALGESGIGGIMAAYGAFDAICSVAAGRLTSGLPSITWIVVTGTSLQFIVFIWIFIKHSFSGGLLGIAYTVLMAAMLGIGDGVLNTQLNALLGMLFRHNLEGAFAQLKVWQSASIAVVFFVNSYISLHAMLVIMLAVLSVSVAGFLYLILRVEKAFSSPGS